MSPLGSLAHKGCLGEVQVTLLKLARNMLYLFLLKFLFCTVIKYPNSKQVMKGSVYFGYGARGIEFIMAGEGGAGGGEAWQQGLFR